VPEIAPVAQIHPASRTGVVRPSWAWFAALDGGIVALVALSTFVRAYDAVAERSPGPFPSRSALRALLAATVVIHVAEAAAAGRNARRRGLPARGWALQTLAVGFPSLLALRGAPGHRPAP
jgi:CRISPR-associated Cas5-like protein